MRNLFKVFAVFAAIASVLGSATANAADYPTRAITLVVPFPPGGGVDTLARVVAEKLSEAFHQQVVVDNRAGGGGTIGTRVVAQAAPDGYTLLLGHTGTISINPSLYVHAGSTRARISRRSADRLDAGGLLAQSVVPGKTDRRIHRHGQERSGQIQSRHLGGRHRRLHVRRTVQVRSRR